MKERVHTHAVFTSQEQACLSWRVLLMSLYTVNSSSNMNAMALDFLLNHGGYHVILVGCCTGEETRLEVTSAHAG